MIYAYVFFHLTTQLLARWAPEHATSASGLTMGLDGIWTFAIHDELVACAALARADADLRTAPGTDGSPIRYGLTRDDGTDAAPVPQYATRATPTDPATVAQRSNLR